ncbi:S-adenosyl-L-methionine-dependent methyltransferase [Infundibulicybe gibba]|nr:S-adenosyl-L-methionine-dependent methyltransferase [Infundibulicybe gibba]
MCSVSSNNPRYELPIDNVEMQRLALQHQMWTLLIGGLYPQSFADTIQNQLRNSVASILDVGCGSGIWSIEMAKRFPTADVIGLDLNKQSYQDAPSNFSFIQGDITTGLPQLREKFNIIHCRCVAQHVPDPQQLVTTLAECLKPGGILLLADGDWVAFDEKQEPLSPVIWSPGIPEDDQIQNQQDLSWYAGWLNMFGELTRSRSYEPIETLVQRSTRFQDQEVFHYLSPINWAGEGIPHGQEIGHIMDMNMRSFFDGGESAMLKKGLSPKMLNIWREKFIEELNQRFYNIWHLVAAVKI